MVSGSARNWIAVKTINNPVSTKQMKTKNMTTEPITNSIDCLPVWRGLILVPLALALFGLLPVPKAFAVTPAPDGGYPGANTAEGTNVLLNLTSGIANTAMGNNALLHDTTGNWNVGIGSGTLSSNTSGSFNMAIGTDALSQNTANFNLAIGFRVGFMNTIGNRLTGIGAGALFHNTSGSSNTSFGADALFSNTTGSTNTAYGFAALLSNTVGGESTAVGGSALLNSIGDGNTAYGFNALVNNTTGDANVALGGDAGSNATTGSNNVYIGAGMDGVAGESNACYIGSIFGQTSASGIPVLINSNNKLATTTSSKRFKEDIKSMGKASEALLALKPVAFRYKKEIDPAGASQFGLVAEEVEKVNPDLVVRDKEGKTYTVRYDAVNAMLLNEFLKEHRKVEKLTKDFESKLAQQQKQIEALTTGLQKVSAQIELSKVAPQTVLNNP
jgi:trimeric autotransporter adhesin